MKKECEKKIDVWNKNDKCESMSRLGIIIQLVALGCIR